MYTFGKEMSIFEAADYIKEEISNGKFDRLLKNINKEVNKDDIIKNIDFDETVVLDIDEDLGLKSFIDKKYYDEISKIELTNCLMCSTGYIKINDDIEFYVYLLESDNIIVDDVDEKGYNRGYCLFIGLSVINDEFLIDKSFERMMLPII